jgi:hypothetical protein
MSYTYRITLTPVGGYYAGGEGSFAKPLPQAVANKHDKNAFDYFKPRQGYIAYGERFMQQTQLLGMLKRQLLLHHNLLYYYRHGIRIPPNSQEKIEHLTGDTIESREMSDNHGIITSLSPLMLWHDDYGHTIAAPMDDLWGELADFDKDVGYVNGHARAYRMTLPGKSDRYIGAKDYPADYFIDEEGDCHLAKDIFVEDLRVHNQTARNGLGDEDRFFKVRRYRLQENWRFVFYATFSKEPNLPQKSIVTIGGEESRFEMRMESESTPDWSHYFAQYLAKSHPRIVLLSDALVDAKIFDTVHVAVAKKVPFRTLKSGKRGVPITTKQIMLTRGSVLYPAPDRANTVLETIEQNNTMQKIGYNHAILLQGETHA